MASILRQEPVPRGVYIITFTDLSGVVAANTFLSVFNPTTSGVLHVGQSIRIASYSTGATAVAVSMLANRVTAASGGTQLAAANVNRFTTVMPNPKAEVRTGNPTVTTFATPFTFKTMTLSTGVANTATQELRSPTGDLVEILPGEGFCLSTSAGSVNQSWSFDYIWAEYTI